MIHLNRVMSLAQLFDRDTVTHQAHAKIHEFAAQFPDEVQVSGSYMNSAAHWRTTQHVFAIYGYDGPKGHHFSGGVRGINHDPRTADLYETGRQKTLEDCLALLVEWSNKQ